MLEQQVDEAIISAIFAHEMFGQETWQKHSSMSVGDIIAVRHIYDDLAQELNYSRLRNCLFEKILLGSERFYLNLGDRALATTLSYMSKFHQEIDIGHVYVYQIDTKIRYVDF